MKTKPKDSSSKSIPNWLLYSGVGLLLSAGALKIAWGLFRIYR